MSIDSTPHRSGKPRGRRLSVPALAMIVTAVSVAAWLSVLVLMAGMDEGPGTPLHNFPIFLVGWIIMLTAMMLPSELNYLGAFAAVLRTRGGAPGKQIRAMISFITGYGIAWIAYGLAAYIVDFAIRTADFQFITWDRGGPTLAGLVLIGAGFYQISSLKHSCLMGCRSPLAFFGRYWRDGNYGAIVMGTHHGLVCVGCCWALMGVMFAVGAMSLTWMALLTVFMFAEKVMPNGQKLAIPIASFLWIMGIWIALFPDTAPLLKNPLMLGSICLGM